MTSPGQPPPPPRGKRKRSPSRERELGAKFVDPPKRSPSREREWGAEFFDPQRKGSPSRARELGTEFFDSQRKRSTSRERDLVAEFFDPQRKRSPSREREWGAEFVDPQLPPSGKLISLGHNESTVSEAGLDLNPRLKDLSLSLGHNVTLGINSTSNMELSFLNSKGNEQSPQLFGDRATYLGKIGSPEAKHGSTIRNSAMDVSVEEQGAKSLSNGDWAIFLGENGSSGAKDGSTIRSSAMSVSVEAGAKSLSNGDLYKGKLEPSFVYKMDGCQAFTYNDLYCATAGFSEKNLMLQFGPSVYHGCLSYVGKVLVRVYDKVHENLEEYKEGLLRRFSHSRAHKNLIELIGSFTDERKLILVYNFPFEVCLGEQLQVAAFEKEKGGLGRYARYRIALELAEVLNHVVKQDIPIIPKLFTEEHVYIGPKGNPVLVDFIGGAQGLGQSFNSTLEVVLHYGILLGKLRTMYKCANGAVLPICDEVWEKVEKDCIQANEFKRPSPEYIIYAMKGRIKELFGLTSPMHDEFRRKYNLEW